MEEVMAEKPAPDLGPVEALQITTPVIDIQDLEHQANVDTRVSNKGVRVEPRIDSDDERDLAKDEEDALLALEQIEKSLNGQLPG
jgi:hypothetical protein